MRKVTASMAVIVGLFVGGLKAPAQPAKPFAEPESTPTIASVMEVQLKIVESQFVPAAAAIRRTERPSGPSDSRMAAAEARSAPSIPALGVLVLVPTFFVMGLAY